MASLHKNLWLMLEFLKGPFLVLHFSYSTLMTFLMMLFVILLSMLLLLPTLKERNSDLWQQLQLASELESDLQETLDWGRKGLVDFNAGKTQLALFDQSNNIGVTDVKMDGSVLEEKSCFKMLGWAKLEWGY